MLDALENETITNLCPLEMYFPPWLWRIGNFIGDPKCIFLQSLSMV